MGMYDKIKKAIGYADKYSSVPVEERQIMDAELLANVTPEEDDTDKQLKMQKALQPMRDMSQDMATATSGIINAGNYSKIMARLNPNMSRQEMLKVIAEEQPKLNQYSPIDNINDLNVTASELIKDSGIAKNAKDLAKQYVGKNVDVIGHKTTGQAYGSYNPSEKLIELYKDANVSTGFHEGSHLYDDIMDNMGRATNTYINDVTKHPEKYSKNVSSESDKIRKIMKGSTPRDEEMLNKFHRNLDQRMSTKDPNLIARDADTMLKSHFIDVPSEYNLIKNILGKKPILHKEPIEVVDEYIKNKGNVSEETKEFLKQFFKDKYK